MFRLLAFAASVSFVIAANGDPTVLCTNLVSGPCSTASNIWPTGFNSVSQCVTFFTAAFANGSDTDTAINTIGCRQHYASLVNASDNSTWFNCKFAGFVSGVCGYALNNTCQAMGVACAGNGQYPYASVDACYADLINTTTAGQVLEAVWGSIQGVPSNLENSLECRMYHALAGNITAPVHCSHVPAASSQCTKNVSVDTAHACGTLNLACTGTGFAQYNAAAPQAMCQSTYAVFPLGPGVAATNNNDQSSRQYHTQAAYVYGKNNIHCAHAGPSGGGTLGGPSGPRTSWQLLTTQASCQVAPYLYLKTSVGAAFAAWNATDLLAIVPTDGNIGSFTSTPAPTANTDSCRIYHLTVATALNSHCTHGDLLGGGQCPLNAPWTPACLMVQTGCGTQNFATQAACETAYTPYFSLTASPYFNNTMTGDPNTAGIPTGDTANCRLYYAGVALASRMAGNMNNTAVCANTAITSNMACTGSAMTPTPAKSAATPLAFSAALSLLIFLW